MFCKYNILPWMANVTSSVVRGGAMGLLNPQTETILHKIKMRFSFKFAKTQNIRPLQKCKNVPKLIKFLTNIAIIFVKFARVMRA